MCYFAEMVGEGCLLGGYCSAIVFSSLITLSSIPHNYQEQYIERSISKYPDSSPKVSGDKAPGVKGSGNTTEPLTETHCIQLK